MRLMEFKGQDLLNDSNKDLCPSDSVVRSVVQSLKDKGYTDIKVAHDTVMHFPFEWRRYKILGHPIMMEAKTLPSDKIIDEYVGEIIKGVHKLPLH